MWKSRYVETKNSDGEKVGKALFWEVGVSRQTQRAFKRTFRRTLEHSTPRKGYEDFLRQFAQDPDFRNQLFLDRQWPADVEWLANREATAHIAAEDITFEVLFMQWRKNASAQWSAKYTQLVDSIWRELKPKLGKRRPKEMTKMFLSDLDSKLRCGGNSRATANRKIAFVRRVMNYAMRTDMITVNPLANFEMPSDPRPKNDFWSEDEARHFLEVTDRRYPASSPRRWVYVAYLTVLNTGVRANELWALKPRNMRPDTNALWLTDQWSPLEKRFTRLKSKDDGQGRAVPMNVVLQRELLALQQVRNLKNDDLFFGVDVSDPWYRSWCKPGASPVDQSNFSKRAWQTDLKLSGNRRIRFHDLRHSAATLMRKNGASREEVRSVLGHSDIQTTARYDHAADDSAALVASRFVLQPKKSKLELVGDTPKPKDAETA